MNRLHLFAGAPAAHIVAPLLTVVILLTSVACGQHADIAVYQNGDGRVTTHDSDAGQTERRVFRRNFDFFGPPVGIFAGDDPGFQMGGTNPPAGYTALPGNSTLEWNLVPLHVPGQALGNLMFWDGNSAEVQFSAPPTNHVLVVEDATGVTEVTLDGSATRFDQLIGGVTDDNGGMHEHNVFALENAGSDPMSGFYLMGWELGVDGLDTSRHALVALNPSSMPVSVRDQLTTWLEDNLDSIRVAGDFDDSGDYGLPDVDSLVEAIAGQAHPIEFDLTLDGLVTVDDLDLWRSIAGAQLTDSGNPILVGDADLDGLVDGLDFILWNDSKFTSVAAWSAGDFNADGIVDGLDFILWNDNKFTSADFLGGDQVISIPEPVFGSFLMLLSALAGLRLGRKNVASKLVLVCGCLYVGLAMSSTANAQPDPPHADVEIEVEDGRLLTEPRVGEGEFGEDPNPANVADEPGFEADDGILTPLVDVIGMNVVDILGKNLWYWDGLGDVNFVDSPHALTLEHPVGGAMTTIDSSSGGGAMGFPLGVADDEGGMHQDIEFILDSATPDAGVYLFGLEMTETSGNYVPSDPVFMVMASEVDEVVHEAAVDWVQTNLVPEPASGSMILCVLLAGLCARKRFLLSNRR